jgi:hypothetical protein
MHTHLQFKDKASKDYDDFLPQHCAWVLQALPVVDPETPLGDGSERSPWRMSSIGQWAAAAQIKLDNWSKAKSVDDPSLLAPRSRDRGLYWVGGRLLERSPGGTYENYITDVLDGGKALVNPAVHRPGFTGVTAMERPRGFVAPVRGAEPVYDTKYARLEKGVESEGMSLASPAINEILAMQARLILWGDQELQVSVDELPGTVAAMFLAEVAREPRMLVLGLMLLDLIQTKVPGFTWHSLMTENGSLTGGVQHPMVHFNAQTDAKLMFKNFNGVTKKSVEILVAWFVKYAEKSGAWDVRPADGADGAPKFTSKMNQVKTLLESSGKPPGRKSVSIWTFCHEAILPALKHRAGTLRCML